MREGMWEAVGMFVAGLVAGALTLGVGIGIGYYNATPPPTNVEQGEEP
ncbi:hypothetical protein AB0E56_13130 [Microbacterium sp. NPDC028030]